MNTLTTANAAIVVYWEASDPDRLREIGENRFVAFLNPQFSAGRILKILREFFLLLAPLTIEERLNLATASIQRQRNFKEWNQNGRYAFGLNPWLTATKAESLAIVEKDDGRKEISWVEESWREDPETRAIITEKTSKKMLYVETGLQSSPMPQVEQNDQSDQSIPLSAITCEPIRATSESVQHPLEHAEEPAEG